MVKQLLVGIGLAATLGVIAAAWPLSTSTPLGPQAAPPRSGLPLVDTTTSSTTTVASTTVAPTTVPSTTTPPPSTEAPTTTAPPFEPGVLLIGDSVLEGLNILNYRFGPSTSYDTEVSRSALHLDTVLAEHELPANVVIHLGTNGWWDTTTEAFSNALEALEGRHVLLVNLRVDRPYTEPANIDIAALAEAHEHVTLIDWASAATPELLRSDGFHPNFEGYDRLAALIAEGLGLPAGSVLRSEPVVPPTSTGQAEFDRPDP